MLRFEYYAPRRAGSGQISQCAGRAVVHAGRGWGSIPTMEQRRIMAQLEICRHCHQPNLIPVPVPAGARIRCRRCADSLRPWSKSLHSNKLAAILAGAGLIFCIPALTLPLMGIRKLGFTSEMGLVEGVISLMHHGNTVLGIILLLCSVVLPLVKIVALLLLSTRGPLLSAHKRGRGCSTPSSGRGVSAYSISCSSPCS